MLELTVVTERAESEWIPELKRVLDRLGGFKLNVRAPSESLSGQILLLDSRLSGLPDLLAGVERRGRAVFLLEDESVEEVPAALTQGLVDDVMVQPFRWLDVLSKLKHYQQILMWEEVTRLNESFSGLIERLGDDLKLAERLQKSRMPARFPDLRGFKVNARYLAGLRPGGDYFDVADAPETARLSVILTDSSSYGLSSAVLTVLMKVVMKLSEGERRATHEVIARVHDELMATLGEHDTLSLFYAMISRKDLVMRYVHRGTTSIFCSRDGRDFDVIEAQGGALNKKAEKLSLLEGEWGLQPKDRLIFVSDGITEALGGQESVADALNRLKKSEPVEVLNELVFQVKKNLKEESEGLPDQDCTAAVMDVDARMMRLA